DQGEGGELMRRQVQLVLEEEADRNVEEAAGGGAEGGEEHQRAEVEKDPVPDCVRQDDGLGGRDRCIGFQATGCHRTQAITRNTGGAGAHSPAEERSPYFRSMPSRSWRKRAWAWIQALERATPTMCR